MQKVLLTAVALVLIVSCSAQETVEGDVVVRPPSDSDLRPKVRPSGADEGVSGGLTEGGLTVAEATTVSAEEIAAAATPATGGEQLLGETIATLGLLERDGIWLATPLVTAEKTGRIVYQQSGVGANVILIPNGAEAGSGSQLSLAAMQALGIPLTELARLKVYAQ